MRSRCQEVTLPTSTLRSRSFIYISTQRKGQACDDFMYPCSLHLTILYNIPSPKVPSFLSPVTPYSPRGYPLAAPLPSKTPHTPTPVSHCCLPLLSSPYAPPWSLLLSSSLPLGLCACQPSCLPCLLSPAGPLSNPWTSAKTRIIQENLS